MYSGFLTSVVITNFFLLLLVLGVKLITLDRLNKLSAEVHRSVIVIQGYAGIIENRKAIETTTLNTVSASVQDLRNAIEPVKLKNIERVGKDTNEVVHKLSEENKETNHG